MITSKSIKRKTFKLGADICGFAPVSRFADAPKGFHPVDIYPDCKSVIVFGARYPLSTLHAKTNSPYTLIRNRMVQKLDTISFTLADDLEKEGITAIPIPSSEPYDYWDTDRRHGRGILSLKHAGMLAGLGTIGKNTLLINGQYGNMIWLGAVLVPIDLKPMHLPAIRAVFQNARCASTRVHKMHWTKSPSIRSDAENTSSLIPMEASVSSRAICAEKCAPITTGSNPISNFPLQREIFESISWALTIDINCEHRRIRTT